MISITKILSKNKNAISKDKYVITIEQMVDFSFLLYLCATSAHQTGIGFDAIFIRLSFVLFLGFTILIMIKDNCFKFNSFLGWFLVFVGYSSLSCVWAKSIDDANTYINTFIQMAGCILALGNRIKKHEDIDKCLKLILYSLLYTSLILIIKTPSTAWGTERIGLDLGLHPNEIGLRFATGVLISLYFAISKKKGLNFVCVAIFTAVSMFTGSRKGVIMCVVSLLFYPLFSHGGGKGQKEFSSFVFRILLIFFSVALLLYLVMNVDIFYNVIGFRIETLIEAYNGDVGADASYEERNFFIRKAIELFKAHPVLGYGANNFRTYMKVINYSHKAYCHNNYLEILSTLGLIGFAIYFSMFVYMLINGVKLFFKKDIEHARNTLLILIFVMVCFMSYWCVSYISEYLLILYILVYTNIKLSFDKTKG